jgi:intracellular sulfur oxidation DsrE/DsrF family protein
MRILSFLTAIVMSLGLALSAQAADTVHKIAFHVDQSDPAIMNMALNNVQNVRNYYTKKGEAVEIEVVAYGPGLKMYTADSPVAQRIASMAIEIDNLAFSACGNTHRAMSEKAGKEVKLLPEAGIVPSGVVRLVELQEQGYAYVRP